MTKPMLKGIAPVKVDTVDLFALAQILPPADQLHVARLRYLKRLLAYCPQTLWNLLMQAAAWPHSWLALCKSSFAWFLQFYQVPGAPIDAADTIAWITHVALGSSWNGRLKKAAKGCLSFRQATAEEHVWLKAFQARFVDAGGSLPCAQTLQSETWVCDQCQKAFPSKRALATHSGRAHGYRRLVKFYAVDQTCNACAKTYATRKRLIEHLRDASECLRTLQACFPCAHRGGEQPKLWPQHAGFMDHACPLQGPKRPRKCTSNGAGAIQPQAPVLSNCKGMPSPYTRHRGLASSCLMMTCLHLSFSRQPV